MSDRKNVNAYKLLKSLPGVLETRDIRIAANWEKKTANEAIFRWVRAGYLTPFAKEVYFNLVSSPYAPQNSVYEAATRSVRRAMVLVGASALNAAGWTTQMPTGYELAIITDRNIRTWKRMAGITAEARSVGWFGRASDHFIRSEDDFDRLPPALALVDAIASAERFAQLPEDVKAAHLEGGTVNWHPDPDDICLPPDIDPATAWREIQTAADILGVPIDIVRDYAAAIPDLEETVTVSSRSGPRQPRY